MHTIEVLHVPDEAIVTGDRADVLDVGIGEVLATMAADRPQVHLVTHGGHSLRGELRSTGLDVARVHADAEGHPRHTSRWLRSRSWCWWAEGRLRTSASRSHVLDELCLLLLELTHPRLHDVADADDAAQDALGVDHRQVPDPTLGHPRP